MTSSRIFMSAPVPSRPADDVYHRVERAGGDRRGQFTLAKIERWHKPEGGRDMLRRTVVDYFRIGHVAASVCSRLNRAAAIAREADALSDYGESP